MGLKPLFRDAFGGRRVLVTGHTGFKGSWLSMWLVSLGAKVSGLALEPGTDPSHWSQLGVPLEHDFRIDVRDAAAVQQAVQLAQPDIVFHLAAQALVRRSYREPVLTFDTNVTGLLHLFEAVRRVDTVRAIVNITTDKVYLESDAAAGHCESDPLGGHDPYSSSKACAELVSECYRKSYFGPQGRTSLATARAGNVIGGGDWSEDRLVPDIVRAAVAGESLLVRNPAAIRPWQHVLDPLSGYLLLGQRLLEGEGVQGPWNFGPDPNDTLSVHRLLETWQTTWPGLQIEMDTDDQPHESAVLRLDCSKVRDGLGWEPVWNVDTAVKRTAQWYREFIRTGKPTSALDLREYEADARERDLQWTR